MKSNFAEYKESKKNAYLALSAKNVKLSETLYNNAKRLGDLIPMGQPILVGHHSESHHRNHIKKMDNNMSKSIFADRKAQYYENKSKALANNKTIFTDDPEAVIKLREKIEKLEKSQVLMKSVNKIIKKYKDNSAEHLFTLGFSEKRVIEILTPDYCNRTGFASYEITSISTKIREAKKRIEHLLILSKLETKSIMIGEVEVINNSEDNRTQIKFPAKPSIEIIQALKRNGFKYAYSTGLWQKHLSNYAYQNAQTISAKYIQS